MFARILPGALRRGPFGAALALGVLVAGCKVPAVALGPTRPDLDDTGSVDTGDSGDTADTVDTADTQDSGDTVDSGDTQDSGDTSDTGPPTPSDCLPWGAVYDELLELTVDGVVDKWDPAWGTWTAEDGRPADVAVNRNAPCAVDVDDSVLHGDVAVLPGGYALRDVVCASNGGEVTGTLSSLDAAVPIPELPLPGGLPESLGAWDLKAGSTRHVWVDATLDSLVVGKGATLEIDESLVLYVTGDVTLDGGSMHIGEGKTLTLFVGGAFTVHYGGTAGVRGAPERLLLQVQGAGPAWVEVGANLYGTVLAPRGAINVSDAHLWGAALARTGRVEWGGGLHVDPRLICE